MGTFLMKTMQSFFMSLLLVLTLGLPGTSRAEAEIPIMDLVDVRGIRENQLVGYGLVVGLAGQGDRNQVKFTSQSITNMLRQFGVQIDDSMNP
ncbi:flagellar basal body P-ring protein FlgI, partial [Vibrio parahaemolyticus]